MTALMRRLIAEGNVVLHLYQRRPDMIYQIGRLSGNEQSYFDRIVARWKRFKDKRMAAKFELTRRLGLIAKWHEEMGLRPIDVSGSDRQRAQRSAFHTNAAKCIRQIIEEYETDS